MNKLQYCIDLIEHESGAQKLTVDPCIAVPPFENSLMPPLFCIAGIQVDSNRLYVYDYNDERHEVKNIPEDEPMINALYTFFEAQAKDISALYAVTAFAYLGGLAVLFTLIGILAKLKDWLLLLALIVVLGLFGSCRKEKEQSDCITFLTKLPDSIATRNLVHP